jgi:rhodanese-related sulfurtransferase
VDADDPDAELPADRDRCTVVYCDCPHDERSVAFVSRLYAAGFTRAFALKGGVAAWKAAGGRLEGK